jgi:DCN1-like protein 1/2
MRARGACFVGAAINRDQWIGIWEFCRNVNAAMSGYDDDGAWPILIDEYVEYARSTLGTK